LLFLNLGLVVFFWNNMYFSLLRLSFLVVTIANTAFVVIRKVSIDIIQYSTGSETLLTSILLHTKHKSKLW